MLLVLAVNLAGSAFGFYYYKELLAASPLTLWIFIPDSATSTLLFSLALLFILLGRKLGWLSFVASVYVMKYGLWTLLVILFYSDYFLAPFNRLFYVTMFVLHFGMILEPVFILPTIERKRIHLVFVTWFLLNDYFDYIVGTHPLLGYPFSNIGVIGLFSVLFSVVLCFIVHAGSGFNVFSRMEINK